MSTRGERIKKLRRDMNWTQDQMADAVGVSRGAISQWENDMVDYIKPQNLFKLARVTRCNPEWLFTGEGEQYIGDQGLSPEIVDMVRTMATLSSSDQATIQTLVNSLA